MSVGTATDWIDEYCRPGVIWYAKRLSANDTLANKSHQAGPYIPKQLLFELFPNLNMSERVNPKHTFNLFIDSHADLRRATATWYNNKTRNEARVTNLGGRSSALLDPDNTGALAIFVFGLDESSNAMECHVWVCDDNGQEADLFEEILGAVEPKSKVVWRPGIGNPQFDLFETTLRGPTSCWLKDHEIPAEWKKVFPTGRAIIRKSIELRSAIASNPDERLIRRRDCEYEIFQSIEQFKWIDQIKLGFTSIDGFLGLAQTVLQSRKSRSGKSLEYHLLEIFSEEGLIENRDFSFTPSIENGKKPDFLFPSVEAYGDHSFPQEKLRMLAAKTTCKDRWRQVLNEADRIKHKHLITLQEGVSENQFREMSECDVQLVVPSSLQKLYPQSVQPYLLSLESFIAELRLL